MSAHSEPRRTLPAALDGAGRRTVARRAAEEMLLLGGWALAADDPGANAALDEVRAVLGGLVGDAGIVDPVEVVNRMTLAGTAGALDFWQSRYVATGRRLLARSGVAGPPSPAALPPRRFIVEIHRRFDLSRAAGRARLRLPLPLAGGSLRDLEIVPILPAAVVEHRIAPGRLEAIVAEPAGAVTIGARLSFTALPGLAEADDAPDPVWLADREGPVAVTPRVRALADRLAARCGDPAAAVRACYDHLLDGFTCGAIPYERIGATPATDWVLATGWYDCRLGAALLVSLCRARGIPARLVGGYLLWSRPTEHFWAEVHLPSQGWTPFDLLGWDLSAGGADPDWRHVLAGAIDYRMPTQRPPAIFTGASGGPSAPAWHRLVRATAGGTETSYLSIPDGRLLYCEELRIIA